jgi:hypothetical protein
MGMRRRAMALAAFALGIGTAVALSPAGGASAATGSTPTYSGFVVMGGPDLNGDLSTVPAATRAAVLQSAQTGQEAVYDEATGTYSMVSASDTDTTGAEPSAAPDSDSTVTPNDVTGGFYLPTGVRRSSYRFDQTSATKLGVVENPDEDIVAEVDIKFSEEITGNTSDYWRYVYSLDYKKGGLYRLNVRLTCAVNETGKPDDYCTSITYPNGAKDSGVTPSHVVEVHDLATGNTVNSNPSGFFGTHSTPPPSGSSQVKKFAHLTEDAYFSDYDTTDQALIRGWDVCVPKKSTFSGVTLCTSSGTGH